MRYRAHRRSLGFTLIELLVVIAIIAVLVALMFPAFARARFKVKCLTCASNLHQWGIAVNLYGADYRGFLPNYWGNQGGCQWDIGPAFYSNPPGSPQNTTTSLTSTLLFNYGISDRRAWFCPMDTSDDTKKLAISTNGRDWWYYSYAFWIARWQNAAGRLAPPFDPDSTSSAAMTNVTTRGLDPGSFPMMSDWIIATSSGAFPMDPVANVAGLTGGHMWNGKLDNGNVLFVNGRVEVHKLTQLKDHARNTCWNSFDFFY